MKISENEIQSGDAEEISLAIINYLKDKYPKTLVDEVVDSIATLKSERAFASDAEVVSAVPVSESEKNKFLKVLETEFGFKGKIIFRTNSEIIGGIIVKIGDKIFDKSVRSSLQQVGESI